MVDLRLRYQTSVFVNAADLKPTPTLISSLLTLYADKTLIPMMYSGLTMGRDANRISRLHVRLTDPSNEWALAIAADRIDVDQNAIDARGSNLSDFASFCKTSIELFTRLLTKYPKKANRLAFNSDAFFHEMPEATLDSTYSKLFNSPQFYREHRPFEWNWRAASRNAVVIGGEPDVLNCITEVSRARGQFALGETAAPFDRLRLFLDVNTTDQNLESRFDLTHITHFFSHAPEIYKALSDEMQGFVCD